MFGGKEGHTNVQISAELVIEHRTLWSEGRGTKPTTPLNSYLKYAIRQGLKNYFHNLKTLLIPYSQAGYPFYDNLANFFRDIGILIDSLSGASCNLIKQILLILFAHNIRQSQFFDDNLTTSAICVSFTSDEHKTIICSLF